MLRFIAAPIVMFVIDIGVVACVAELINIGIGSIFFLISGDFVSVIEHGLLQSMSWVGLWDFRTGLVGFDYLLNAYLNLQFTAEGRWSLLGISALAFLGTIAYDIYNDGAFSELLNGDTAIGAWVVGSAAIPSLIVVSPIWLALFVGTMTNVLGIP